MSSDRIAISVRNVSKDFNLPHLKTNSIKDIFTNPLQLLGGIKTNEPQHALKDISFDIKEGEFFGIVGRNGSGKSTLLKIIAEIYQPTKGEVSVAGRLVPFIELGVGFNPELTGRENVYLSCALNGFSTAEVDAMYDDIVEFAELGEFMDQKLKNYSSGMQVRLAFSVATRSNADVLLIDEVLAVGDADFQRKCFNYFKVLKEKKVTVVFVSHDMSSVREFCDRGVLIENNSILYSGSPEELAAEYAKLFSKKNMSDKDGNRWGDRSFYYEAPAATLRKSGNGAIEISAELHVAKSITDPVIGFKVTDASGVHLLGTNSKLENKLIGKIGAGEVRKIAWTIDDVFNTGRYYVEITAVYGGMTQVADWWTNAVSFEVIKENKTPYLVRPQTELEVNVS